MRTALEIGPGEHPAAAEGDGYLWFHIEHPDVAKSLSWVVNGIAGGIGVWGEGPLLARGEQFDLVYASHVLEHVSWTQTGVALAEAYRQLKPAGCLEVWVPNFAYLVDCYLKGQCGDDWRHENPDNDPMVWLNGRLFSYGPEPNFHKAMFTPESLENHLLRAGFSHVDRLDPHEQERGHKHGPISLGMRSWKR